MGDAYAADYKSSLADLNCNSKPQISCMTMLAEENIQYAAQIVKVIIEHIHSVSPETKLPVLYLIDSIIKNVGKQYFTLFSQSIASIFASVFEKVDENTRALMYKLRQTWNGIFPNKILYSIDTRVKQVDPAWPITAQPPTPSIHVNPKFLAPNKVEKPSNKTLSNQVEESEKLKAAQNEVLKTLFEKQKTLRELEERKRELAAKQFLSSQLPHGTADSSAEVRGDPRIHAKFNPNLNQRDPRVKKALSAMLNKKTMPIICKQTPSDSSQKSVKEVKRIPSVIASTISNANTNSVSSVITARPTVSIPSTVISSVEVQKQETRNSPSKNFSVKIIRGDDSSKSHKPSQVPSENRKESAKNSAKSSKHDSCSVSPSKVISGKRKRRSDEKMLDVDKSDNSSPSKKMHRDKGSKKKDSPKSKNVDKSEHSKDSKKLLRSRSRSPIPKFVKDYERASVADDLHMRKKENILEMKHRDDEVKNKDSQKLNVSNDTKKNSPVPNTEDSKENIEDLQKEILDSSEKNDDGIFARQDQDYRTMSKGLKSSPQKGWAMYKAAHPDQFRMPHPTHGNEKRGFEDFKKMQPRHGRAFYDNGRTEYDRLGRPKISRARIMQSSYISRFPPREFDNRSSGRNPLMDKRLYDIFSGNPKDVLRQAKEQYRLGRISENQLCELQRDLERAWASEEYQHFKEMQQHSRDFPPFDEFNVPFNERDRQIFHNRMDPGFTSNNGPHPLDSDNQYRMNDRGFPAPPPDTSTFRLDNKNRVIHFIDDKAVILLDNGEPRELIFRGQPTQVEIEGLKPIMLRFDGKPVTFELNGNIYSLKFGAPSRELYINNIPYKGEFAGPPFEVVLGGQIRRVRLSGPQPQVQVIDCPVSEDLYRRVMGRTRGQNVQNTAMHLDVDMRGNAVIDPTIKDTDLRLGGPDMNDMREKSQFPGVGNFRGQPVFNAGQPPMMGSQYRESMQDPRPWDHQNDPNKVPSISEQVRHSESGRSQNMSLQDSRYPCEPQPPTSSAPFNQHLPPPNAPWPVRDYSHEVQGPPPAQVPESLKTFNAHRNSPTPLDSLSKEYSDTSQRPRQSDLHSVPRPLFIGEHPQPQLNQLNIQSRLPLPPLPPWLNNPPPDQKALPVLPPPPRPPLLMGMGMPPELQSVPVSSGALSMPGIQVPLARSVAPPPLTAPPPFPPQSTAATVPPAFDIGILFNKLLAAGIISKPSVPVGEEKKETEDEVKEKKKADEDEEEEEEEEDQYIPPIEWKMDSLKGRYSGVTTLLYKGSECQSCGMRFRDHERYSRHLDWHFRMNRREKDGVKKAFSRKWYYEVEDWIQFEEFVDIDDRARSFFEMQADQQFEMEESAEQPSVPTMGREAEACVVCGETFKLFWVEEEEEWHLKNAVRQDEQVYHPSCYEDFKKASEKAATEAEARETIIKEEPLSPTEETVIQHDKDFNVDADLASIKIEIDESVTDLMNSLVTLVVEGIEANNESLPKVDEEVVEKVDEMEQEEVLQGKPGEEEIIGLISELEEMDTHDNPPLDDSEKVVIESGGIIMKFRAESLKPASPATDANAEKDTVSKDSSSVETKEEEEVDEFRPPTPDPRFKQMPPVQRGLELSGMCCIM